MLSRGIPRQLDFFWNLRYKHINLKKIFGITRAMSNYKDNHYVPVWYQKRFLLPEDDESKFFYLDMKPETITSNGVSYKRNALLHWGPKRCFHQRDLYTTKFGKWESTQIEEKFFRKVDTLGEYAVDYFSKFTHPSANHKAYQAMLPYMSTQKLRTPKGLSYLSSIARVKDKNNVLYLMQELQEIYCAIWTECIWSIADATESDTKLIVSDHPITVYNKECFPASKCCKDFNDPDIRFSATHTLFPLSIDKLLILTNLSWVRYPYGNPLEPRPNPDFFRPSIFNFMQIQTGRVLSDLEVNEINYIIKKRAYRYIAAAKEEWLYPENKLHTFNWDKFGEGYLLMPDPRSVVFSSEIIVGYKKGADFFDAYGRKPWQKGYDDKDQHNREWETFHAFKGEFARLFGPRRRGVSFNSCRLENTEDSPDSHASHLRLEKTHRKFRYKK